MPYADLMSQFFIDQLVKCLTGIDEPINVSIDRRNDAVVGNTPFDPVKIIPWLCVFSAEGDKVQPFRIITVKVLYAETSCRERIGIKTIHV